MSTVEARLVFDSYPDISLQNNEQSRRGTDDTVLLQGQLKNVRKICMMLRIYQAAYFHQATGTYKKN